MNRLLELLWQGKAVDAEASKAMLELMKRCRTGNARIRGLLPRDTVVAHKTGSLGGTVDDIGIIYLPQGAGHVTISALSKRTLADSANVERVIAEIARYAYDYFLFTAPAVPSSQ
jgi:beta-lactamase class A